MPPSTVLCDDATRRSGLARALAWLLLLAVGAGLLAMARSSRYVMDADEAVHAVEALRRFDRLEHGRLWQFLVDSYLPERWQAPVQDHVRWYAIVHSWSMLPFFALLGPGDFAARLPSVLYWVASGLLVFHLARRLALRLDPHAARADWGAAAAVFLFASAPNLITFTPQALTEPCVLFWCLAALTSYVAAVGAPDVTPRAAWRTGALLALAVLAKYDHGVLLCLCLGAAEVVRVARRPDPRTGLRTWLRGGSAAMFGVPLALFALWLAHPDKWAAFRDTLAHPAYGSWRVIAANFVASWVLEYTSSLAALGVILACASWALRVGRARGDAAVGGVLLAALLATLLLAARARFQFRFNWVEMPLWFVLAGGVLPSALRAWARALDGARLRRRAGAGLLALGIATAAGVLAAERAPGLLEAPLGAVLRAGLAIFPGRLGLSGSPSHYAHGAVEALRRAVGLLDASLAGVSLGAASLGLVLLLERAGAGVERAARRLKVLIAALALATLPGALAFAGRAPTMIRWEWEGLPGLHEIDDLVAVHVRAPATVLLAGGWDQYANNTLQWNLATRALPRRPPYDDLRVVGDMIGSLVLPSQPRIRYWADVLRSAATPELPEVVVLIAHEPWFVYREPEPVDVPLYRAILEQRGCHDLTETRTLEDLGVTVEIWQRKDAPVAPLAAPRGAAARTSWPAQRPLSRGRFTPGDKAWRHGANPWR